MKRFNTMATAIAGMLVLSCSVSAENIYNKDINYNDGVVIIKGNTDKSPEPVTVQVFKGDKKAMDFADSPMDAAGYVVHVDRLELDENGDFEFTFKYAGDENLCDASGIEKLNVCIVYNDTKESLIYPLSFVDGTIYEMVVNRLNNAAGFEEFKAIVEEYPFLLNLDSGLAKSVDMGKVTEFLYDDIKSSPVDKSDYNDLKQRGVTAVVARAVKENKLDSILTYADDMKIPAKLLENIRFFVSDAKAEKEFLEFLNGKNIQNTDELEEAVTEAVILTAVRYPKGFMNLKNLCEEYDKLIGISGKSYSNDAYKAVAGSEKIDSLSELKDELSDYSKNSSSGSGGSSGGGGGGSRGTGTSVSMPAETTKTEKKETLNMPFEDLASVEWAHVAISTLSDRGIINGKSDKAYCPGDNITREEFIKIIVCTAGAELYYSENLFDDVDIDSWYAPYVNGAKKNGFCNGIDSNNFGVGMNITRQDAAVMIYNALMSKNAVLKTDMGTEFEDKSYISDYAKEAVERLSGAGIVKGDNNKNFNPKEFLTRAEAAQLVYNCLNLF